MGRSLPSRFVTLEEISSEAAALTLLDTHVTDYGAGAAFFGDAYRMHEGTAGAGAVGWACHEHV